MELTEVKVIFDAENIEKCKNEIINAFYENPILSVKDIVLKTGIPDKTVRNLLGLMLEDNLIKEMTGYERNKLFIFEKYFNLFK